MPPVSVQKKLFNALMPVAKYTAIMRNENNIGDPQTLSDVVDVAQESYGAGSNGAPDLAYWRKQTFRKFDAIPQALRLTKSDEKIIFARSSGLFVFGVELSSFD